MAIHSNDLAASVALIFKNLSLGIKDGQTCGIVVQSSETALQLSGEIIFDGEVIQATTENEGTNDKVVTTLSPEQVTQVGNHEYTEQVDEGGITNGANGVALGVKSTFVPT